MPPKRIFKKRVFKKKIAYKNKKQKVSVAVKAYVKRTIHADIENKCVQINAGNSFGNVLESPDFNAYPMCPLTAFWTIAQGVTQGTRIGNKIQVRKIMLNYILRPTSYDAVFNPSCIPSEVQLMLGYVKQTPTTLPTNFDVGQLFQAGASSAAPVETVRDIISVINKDFWVIKKRWTHKIGYAINDGTGGAVAQQYQANNDFKLNVVKKIDITGYCPKTISFNDGSPTPTTKNLFFMYYAVGANGNLAAGNNLPANIEFWIDFHYEDA